MFMLDIFTERQFRKRFKFPENNIRTWTNVATVIFFGLVALVLFVGLLFAWYAKDLPRPDKVRRVEGLSTVVLDRNGESLYDIYQDANRIPAEFADIPQYLKDATVAVEDKEFYKHQGLSLPGIARAIVSIFIFHNFQGGS